VNASLGGVPVRLVLGLSERGYLREMKLHEQPGRGS